MVGSQAAKEVVCPWKFLEVSSGNFCSEKMVEASVSQICSPKHVPSRSYAQIARDTLMADKRKSFLDKVRNEQPQHFNVADLPKPCTKGQFPSIKLPRQALERGRLYCKYCLVGRLDFQKISLDKVRQLAASILRPCGDWKIIPLGKGFFMLKLGSEDELIRIWTGGPWKFENQIPRLSRWTPDFDPEVQKTSKALVWAKFPKLGQQYWDYEILMSLGAALGEPIGVDRHTLNRDFGFFASVLVEVDLCHPIPSQIVVEEEDGCEFSQTVEISNLPKFCSHCKALGHGLHECKSLHKVMRSEEEKSKETHEIANRRRYNKKKDVTDEPNEGSKVEGVEGTSTHVFECLSVTTFPQVTTQIVKECQDVILDEQRLNSTVEVSNVEFNQQTVGTVGAQAISSSESVVTCSIANQNQVIAIEEIPVKTVNQFVLLEEEEHKENKEEIQKEDKELNSLEDSNVAKGLRISELVHFRLIDRNGVLVTNVHGVSLHSAPIATLESLLNSLLHTIGCEGEIVDDHNWGKLMQLNGDFRKEAAIFMYDIGLDIDLIKIHKPSRNLKQKFSL